MKIHCGQARDELALEVGQDLETGLSPELQVHLKACPDCCRAWLELQEAHGHLQHLKHDSAVVESPGLWSDVEIAIEGRGLRPQQSSFPSWVLGVAVGVLFTVLVLDSFRSPVSDDEMLIIEVPVGSEPSGVEAAYRPQWPPLVRSGTQPSYRQPGMTVPTPSPRVRPWRRSSGIPIARSSHEILRASVNADF